MQRWPTLRPASQVNTKDFGKTGFKVSEIGMGTYYDPLWIAKAMLGLRSGASKKREALAAGIQAGINFIDTAELYGSETIVAEAIKGVKRDELFIATKVWQLHLHRDSLIRALEKSLERLGLSYVDLYQLHFPNPRVPIAETMGAMEEMKEKGKLINIGVSNFSLEQLIEATSALKKSEIASNQVNYSLAHRNIERDLLPHCQKEGIGIVAYFPLGHGKLTSSARLSALVQKYSKTPAQFALNWLASKPYVYPIPRASSTQHVLEDAGSSGWGITQEDTLELERLFPA